MADPTVDVKVGDSGFDLAETMAVRGVGVWAWQSVASMELLTAAQRAEQTAGQTAEPMAVPMAGPMAGPMAEPMAASMVETMDESLVG